ISCTNVTNGRPTCASSTWKKSRRFRTPLSHPFVERLIGTIRRECLDRTLFWTAADLEMKLLEFQRYFNGHRAHAALDGRPTETIPEESGVRARRGVYLRKLQRM